MLPFEKPTTMKVRLSEELAATIKQVYEMAHSHMQQVLDANYGRWPIRIPLPVFFTKILTASMIPRHHAALDVVMDAVVRELRDDLSSGGWNVRLEDKVRFRYCFPVGIIPYMVIAPKPAYLAMDDTPKAE